MSKREPFSKTAEAIKAEADALAPMLSRVTGQTWTAHYTDQHCWRFHVENEQGHRLSINLNKPKKYEVSVVWDGGRSHRYVAPDDNKTFGIGYDRGVNVLAVQIERRVLPYLVKHWDKMLAKVKDDETNENTRYQQYLRLMKRFGKEKYSKERTQNHGFIYATGAMHSVKLNHDGSRATVDMSRGSLPIETVHKLIDWLEENVGIDD